MDGTIFSSRAGAKLAHALNEFHIDVSGTVCADLGCSTGGFTDCLLQSGAVKVYSVDTGYGVLDYKLRQDPRVVVMERTNALHVNLPEAVDLVTIDVSWTRQKLIVPKALTLLKPEGQIISLLKPHYEAQKYQLSAGHLREEELDSVVNMVRIQLTDMGINIRDIVRSPVLGEKGRNAEFLIWITG